MDNFSVGERFTREAGAVRKELRKRTFSYVAAGLGLVAGLAWNDAIKLLIEYLLPQAGNTLVAKFAYAFLVTVFVAFALYYVERSLKEDVEK